tara:strand:- start:14 stop:130 length:117 start_codon:yes stop_codon:yes gene_type:complete
MILDILLALLVIIGLCCVVVTQDYAKEVNDKIDKELQE